MSRRDDIYEQAKLRKWSIVLVVFILIITTLFFHLANSQSIPSRPKQGEVLLNAQLVNKFYQKWGMQQYWLTPEGKNRQKFLFEIINNASSYGLKKERYHVQSISAYMSNTSASIDDNKIEFLFTDALISFCRDLSEGYNINETIHYDEFSAKYTEQNNDRLISGLTSVNDTNSLRALINSLEPDNSFYASLKEELRLQQKSNSKRSAEVSRTLNYYRWLYHFHFEKMIVVNIPSATLRYFGNNTEQLFMKVVVGKPATKTPRFAASCNEVILYPYWNVPRDIGIKELLPKFRRDPSLVDAMNMQIVNASGKVVSYCSIAWKSYSKSNFPYRFRQSTGCDNSLGVIKFNLTDPYTVYLHDTNFKLAFASQKRFYSHGCIRLDKPMALAEKLLDNKLDTTFLKACMKNEMPQTIPLHASVPVMVVYLTAWPDEQGKITYFQDIYHLNQ